MKTNGNDPISCMPSEEFSDRFNEGISLQTGLSKREYFAAMALNGILSSRGLQEALNADRTYWEEEAVEQADKLIEALNKGNK